MVKVFTTNKDGKIELTKEELKSLLDEAFWDGYRAYIPAYIYTTPTWSPYTSPTWSPYTWTATNGSATNVTLTNTATSGEG